MRCYSYITEKCKVNPIFEQVQQALDQDRISFELGIGDLALREEFNNSIYIDNGVWRFRFKTVEPTITSVQQITKLLEAKVPQPREKYPQASYAMMTEVDVRAYQLHTLHEVDNYTIVQGYDHLRELCNRAIAAKEKYEVRFVLLP